MKMVESFPEGQKTLWEKEKLLNTSNFSFSHSVFIRLVLQTCKNKGLFGKGLIIVFKSREIMLKVSLTFSHTFPTFNDPDKEAF